MNQWHAGVGRAIVESWGFPENIAQAVDECDVIERERYGSANISDLVLTANLLSSSETRGEEIELPEDLRDLPSLSRMGTSADAVETLMRESVDETESMIQAMTG